jgi:hypothetical protein
MSEIPDFRQQLLQSIDQLPSKPLTKKEKVLQAADQKIKALQSVADLSDRREDSYSDLGTGSDYVRDFTSGAAVAVGRNTAELLNRLNPDDRAMISQATGIPVEQLPEPILKQFADALTAWGEGNQQEILDQQLPEHVKQREGFQPTGEWWNPLSWKLGEESSWGGFGSAMLSEAGESSAQLAALAITRGGTASGMAAAGGAGFLESAGAARSETSDYIDSLNDQELAKESEMFRDLVSDGMKPDVARLVTKQEAINASSNTAGTIGALGGAATSKILSPLKSSSALTSNILGRAVGKVGLSTGESIAEEIVENTGARAASNLAIGGNRDIDENTFADALLGGGFGASVATPSFVKDELTRPFSRPGAADTKERNENFRKAVDDKDIDAWGKLSVDDPVLAAKAAAELIETGDEKGGSLRLQHLINTTNKNIATIEEQIKAQDTSTEEGSKTADKLGSELSKERENLIEIYDVAKKQVLSNIENRNAKAEAEAEATEEKTPETPQPKSTVAPDPFWGNTETKEETPEQPTETPESKAKAETRAKDFTILAMLAPEEVTDGQIQTALKEGTLTDEQREYLEGLVDLRSKEKESSLDKTSNGIYKGDEEYAGIITYNDRIQSALAVGDKASAEKALEQMRTFTESHKQKLEAAREAHELYKSTGNVAGIVNRDGKWVVQKNVSKDKMKKIGGLSFYGNTKLIERMQDEVEALETYGAQFERGIAVTGDSLVSDTESSEFDTAIAPTVESRKKTRAEKEAAKKEKESKKQSKKDKKALKLKEQEEKAKTKGGQIFSEPTKEEKKDEPVEAYDEADDYYDDYDGTYGDDEIDYDALVNELNEGEEEQAPQGLRLKGTNTEQTESEKGAQAKPETPVEEEKETENSTSTKTTEDDQGASNEESTQTETETEQTESSTESELPSKEAKRDGAKATELKRDRESRKQERSKDLSKMNVFKAFFKRVRKGRPLASVRDLMSSILEGDTDILKFLPKDVRDNLTEEQSRAINHMLSVIDGWSADLGAMKVVTKGKGEKDYLNPINSLLDEDGNLPENVLTAASVAAYIYSSEHPGVASWSVSQINSFLGREDNHPISPEDAFFFNAGQSQNEVIDTLGNIMMQIMGYTPDDTPRDVTARVRVTLGGLALVQLELQDLVEVHSPTIETEEIKDSDSAAEKARKEKANRRTSFWVRPNRFKNNRMQDLEEANPLLNDIVENTKDTGGIIRELFSADKEITGPVFEADSTVSKKKNKSPQNVSSVQKAQIEKVQNDEYRLRPVVAALFSILGADKVKDLAGRDHRDEDTIYPNNVEKVRSQNNKVEREVDHAFDHIENTKKQSKGIFSPFYFMRDVWKQGRSGIRSNTFNPLNSKIHRALSTMTGWLEEIDTTNDEDRAMYFAALADELSPDGMTTDKGDEAAAVARTIEFLAELEAEKPEVIAAYKALVKATDEADASGTDYADIDLDPEVVEALQDVQDIGVANVLADYARFLLAEEVGGKFTTTFHRATDGVTSGMMLALLQLGGAANPEDLARLLERTGVFSEESGYENHNQWLDDPENKDIYNSAAQLMNDSLTEIGKQEPEARGMISALSLFLNRPSKEEVEKAEHIEDIVDRNAAKEVVLPFSFSAGQEKMRESLAGSVINGYMDAMEEAFDLGDDDWKQELINNFNQFLPADAQIQAIDEVLLSKAQIEFAMQQIDVLLEKPVASAFEGEYGELINARNQVNYASQFSFTIMRIVESEAVDSFIKENIEYREGKNGEIYPVRDLTPSEEKQVQASIKEAMALVHNTYSQASGNDLDSATVSAKTDITTDPRTLYSTQITLENKNGVSVTTRGSGRSPEILDPGVSLFPSQIHGLDSHTMLEVHEEHDVFSAHDSAYGNVRKSKDIARSANKAVFNQLLNYSVMQTTVDAIARQFEAFVDRLENVTDISKRDQMEKELREEAEKQIAEMQKKGLFPSNYDYGDRNPVEMLIAMHRVEAIRADRVKLQTMAKSKFWNQYSREGGAYELTDEDYAAIEAKLQELNAMEAALGLNPTVNSTGFSGTSSSKIKKGADTKPKKVGKVSKKPVDESPRGQHFYGELSRGSNDHNSNSTNNTEVQKVFKAAPQGSLGPLLYKLAGLKPKGKNASFFKLQQELAKRVSALTKGVKYVYVDKGSPSGSMGQAQKGETDKMFAWFDPSTNTVYVKSPDFYNSNVNMDTVLHEALHAALAHHIRSNPNSKAVKELKALMEKAQAEINKKYPGENRFANAFENVDEFISWGMTDAKLMKELASIELDTKDLQKNKSLWDKFVDTAMDILGWAKGEERNNVLSALIYQTAHLMEEAEEANTPREGGDSILGIMPQRSDTTSTATAMELFGDLAARSGLSSERADSLRSQLRNITQKLYGPLGAYAAESDKTAVDNPVDAYLKSLATGVKTFVGMSTAKLGLNEAEQYVLHQTQLTTEAALKGKHINQSALNSIYNEAKSTINPSDLPTGVYEFIFGRTNSAQSTSEYLSRFTAIAMTYEPLQQMMQDRVRADIRLPYSQRTLAGGLRRIFNAAMSIMSRKLPYAYKTGTLDNSLRNVVDHMVDLERKERRRVKDIKRTKTIERNIGLNKMRDVISDVSKSKAIQDSAIPKAIKDALVVAGTAVSDKGGEYLETLVELRDKSRKGLQNPLDEYVTELMGTGNKAMASLLRISNKHQQDRQGIIDQTEKVIMDAFENGGKNLSKAEKSALTRALLRTDISSLLKEFGGLGVADLLTRENQREALIKNLESQLTGKHKHYYLRQSKDLGYFLATGIVTSPNLMMNARNIAYMANTKQKVSQDSKELDRNEKIIDQLVSLYAVKYLPDDIKSLAEPVIRREANRGTDNGVSFLLGLHSDSRERAQKQLFKDNPHSFMKGYTHDNFSTKRSMVRVPKNEVARYEKMGLETYEVAAKDPTDPSTSSEYVLMILPTGAKPYTTGIAGLSGKRARGTAIHGGEYDVLRDQGMVMAKRLTDSVTKKKQNQINSLFQPNPNYTPTPSSSYLVPNLGMDGEATNYRYMMSEDAKDEALARNNQVGRVLGAMDGSIYDRQGTDLINKQLVRLMKDEYDTSYKLNPDAYVTFSPNSNDPRIKETYNMLPDEMKKEIRKVWGSASIKVRADQFNRMFGYRKYSISSIWHSTPEERMILTDILVRVTESMFGPSVALRVRQAEDVWQELVAVTKDIRVIKNLFTLLGNIQANLSFLLWQGITPKQIVDTHVEALEGVIQYQTDKNELFKVEALLRSGMINGKGARDLYNRRAELLHSIDTSPVKDLIDAGMLQTIVEDVSQVDSEFDYLTRFSEYLSEKTSFVPDGLKTAGKTVLMTHDTPLYKVLHRSTALSDFVARYSLYKQLTEVESMPKAEALHEISEAFVNYDDLAGQKMDYMNDMGIFWFTRYYTRIQKVIIRTWRKHPLMGLLLLMATMVFPMVPTILDSSFVSNINWPFGMGAFALPGAIDEIATIKAGTALF